MAAVIGRIDERNGDVVYLICARCDKYIWHHFNAQCQYLPFTFTPSHDGIVLRLPEQYWTVVRMTSFYTYDLISGTTIALQEEANWAHYLLEIGWRP